MNSLQPVQQIDLTAQEHLRRFIPVCLYTRLYNKRRCVREILKRYATTAEATLIVVADDLQAYNKINRGHREEVAFHKARIQGDNLRRMFSKEIEDLGLQGTTSLLSWREITSRPDYKSLLGAVSHAFRNHDDLRQLGDRFVAYHLRQLRSHQDDVSNEWETRYLLEEIAMSIFIGECFGYPDELWELPPKWNEPDPLLYLYESCSDLVLQITEKTQLERQLEFLPFDDIHMACHLAAEG